MPYALFRIPLLVGQINIKHKSNTLFSERYSLVPTFVVGPLRFTWRRRRSLHG